MKKVKYKVKKVNTTPTHMQAGPLITLLSAVGIFQKSSIHVSWHFFPIIF